MSRMRRGEVARVHRVARAEAEVVAVAEVLHSIRQDLERRVTARANYPRQVTHLIMTRNRNTIIYSRYRDSLYTKNKTISESTSIIKLRVSRCLCKVASITINQGLSKHTLESLESPETEVKKKKKNTLAGSLNSTCTCVEIR